MWFLRSAALLHNSPVSAVQRGSITLWIDEAICTRWYANERVGKSGAPTLYSDGMIQMELDLDPTIKPQAVGSRVIIFPEGVILCSGPETYFPA